MRSKAAYTVGAYFFALLYFAWLRAVIIRLRKKDSAYNKYVFAAAVILYLTCNFNQEQTFAYKTLFSIL